MGKRALVVDDEVAACSLIRDGLSSSGIDAVVVTKSYEAADYLRKEKFLVVLLDFRMPTPDGSEIAREMRRGGFNQMTPIIMLSEDQELKAVSQGFQAGANFFVYKPIDKGRLMMVIRAAQGAIEHETRRFRRVPFRSRVDVRSGEIETSGETINVSMDGMLLRASRVIPRGAAVHVSLHLAAGMKPVVGMGSVMRTTGENEMAIRLNRMSIAENCRLQEFLLPMILQDRPEASPPAS